MCTDKDLEELEAKKKKLGNLLAAEESSKKSWYKTGDTDIPVFSKVRTPQVQPLSKYSKVIENMRENNQVRLYVDSALSPEADKRIREGHVQ